MITRAQMPRQLRNKGGMTVGSIRQKYGLGSLVRKLIPNEVANFAAKAAPFVAPFNPIVGGLMRGIGRYDKRGNLGDALKQGALTAGFGKGINVLSKIPFGKGQGTSIADRLVNRGFDISKPVQTTKNILLGQPEQIGSKKATPGIFGAGGEFNIFKGLGGGRAAVFTTTALASVIKDALTKVPPQEAGETLEDYMARRKSTVGGYLKQYLGNTRKFQNLSDEELNALVEKYNTGYDQYASGGRVGYAEGTSQEMFPDNIDDIGPRRSTPQLRKMPEFRGDEVKPSDMMMASNMENDKILEALFEKFIDMGLSPENAVKAAKQEFERMSMMKMESRQMANMGGMMSIPVRQNKAGVQELDMRKSGGFVPVGVKEKADDVPAMLSKNEFVMTADAVRAAGGGSVQKGAQKMYDTMKKLESRVA